MAEGEEYDYSAIAPFLEPFNKWVQPEPFFTESEELYGKLWQCKAVVESWTFGVKRFKKYVFLRYKVKDSTTYLNWNLNEKVALIENHQKNYMVITLLAHTNDGESIKHSHSIVCHEDDHCGIFDFYTLITDLQSASLNDIADEFTQKFSSWTRKDA